MRRRLKMKLDRRALIAGLGVSLLTTPTFAGRAGGDNDGDCGCDGDSSSGGGDNDNTPNTRTCGFVTQPNGQGGYRIFAVAQGYNGVLGRNMSTIAELEIRGTDTGRTYNSRDAFNNVTKNGRPIVNTNAFLNDGTLNNSSFSRWAEGELGGSQTLAQCAQEALQQWIRENGDEDCLEAVIISRGRNANRRLNYTPIPR
jgi:hypothetical protein